MDLMIKVFLKRVMEPIRSISKNPLNTKTIRNIHIIPAKLERPSRIACGNIKSMTISGTIVETMK